jgi:hypothetical protein
MAVKTKAQILSEIASLLSDNTTGDISANDVRTVVNDITDSYEDLITAGTTSQYWRGDKTWQTLPIYEATGTLTSAQINALDTTAIQLIASPGANKLLLIENASFNYVAGATGFTSGNIEIIYATGDVINQFNSDSAISGTTSKVINILPVNVLSGTARFSTFNATVINQAIKIQADNSASGNGSIKYSIKYRIINF